MSHVMKVILLLLSLSLSNPETTALLALKSSTDTFNSLSSWVASSDPCSGTWFGVACDPATRRVTRIVLENLNLTGSAHQLTQLAHLKLLSLNRNRLSSSLDFSAWHNLNHMYLSHNRFDGALPAGISRQRHLPRLDLSHNQFSGEIPLAEFAQLPHLLTLRLESNSFTGGSRLVAMGLVVGPEKAKTWRCWKGAGESTRWAIC